LTPARWSGFASRAARADGGKNVVSGIHRLLLSFMHV
jgi:hypothetical protein